MRHRAGAHDLNAIASWCAAAAAYLLLAGQAGASECATAAAVATLAAGWRVLARRAAPRRFGFAGMPGHARAWAGAFGAVPPATARTGLALARVALRGGSPGRADHIPFERGAPDDPAARARRATALLTASLAPDSYIVRAPPGGTVLRHAILPDPRTPDPRWLR